MPVRARAITDKKYYAFVLLLWCGIFMSPRISSGDIFGFLARLRYEDFLIPVLVRYLSARRRELRRIIGPSAWKAVCFWVLYILSFTSINIRTVGVPAWVGAAFAGKELQYILYFLFFSVFASQNSKWTIQCFAFAIMPLYLYILWQFSTGQFSGYYGFISLPWESGVSQSGAVLAILFICAVALLLNKKNTFGNRSPWINPLLYFVVVVTFGTLVLTLSRTSIIAGIAAFAALISVRIWRARLNLAPFLMLLVIAAAAVWIACRQLPLYEIVMNRFSYIKGSGFDRLEKCAMVLSYQAGDMLALLGGFGLGSVNFIVKDFSDFGLLLAVGNQFVRRFFELGFLGTFLWLTLWGCVAARILVKARAGRYHSAIKDSLFGVFIVMLVMSMGMEAFQLVRPASTFYALMGVLLGLASASSQNNSTNNASILDRPKKSLGLAAELVTRPTILPTNRYLLIQNRAIILYRRLKNAPISQFGKTQLAQPPL
jgi:hypothetical protein